MMEITWSRSAKADFDRCIDFLDQRDPDAANSAALAIYEGVQILRDHPRAGSPASSGSSGRRDWTIRFGNAGYVLRYRIDAGTIIIVQLRHMREAPFFQR